MSDGARRAALALVALLAVLGLAWHASPLLLWHLRFEALLAAEAEEPGLGIAVRASREPRPEWSRLRVANLAVRAPIGTEEQKRCGECAGRCVLSLEGGGTLAVFDTPPMDDLGQARDRIAPDPRDLSLLRSVARNWQTIDALTDYVRAAGNRPESFRFSSAGSQGVAAGFTVNGVRRYAVQAYGPRGEPTRALGVTGVSEEDFDRILGGLTISAHPDEGQATCR